MQGKDSIVICGSMSFYNEMVQVKNELYITGINAVIPDASNDFYRYSIHHNTKKTFNEMKSHASRVHFSKIWRLETKAILVVNNSKRGIENYIGPNSIAEIALAFALRKKIFLLYNYPIYFLEELEAWGVIALEGNLDLIVKKYHREKNRQLFLPGLEEKYGYSCN